VVRSIGPSRGTLRLPGSGGRGSFGSVPIGEWHLQLEYQGRRPEGPDGEAVPVRGTDRSPPFQLGPGGAVVGRWSLTEGWVLIRP
jgi:hypothetical protein